MDAGNYYHLQWADSQSPFGLLLLAATGAERVEEMTGVLLAHHSRRDVLLLCAASSGLKRHLGNDCFISIEHLGGGAQVLAPGCCLVSSPLELRPQWVRTNELGKDQSDRSRRPAFELQRAVLFHMEMC